MRAFIQFNLNYVHDSAKRLLFVTDVNKTGQLPDPLTRSSKENLVTEKERISLDAVSVHSAVVIPRRRVQKQKGSHSAVTPPPLIHASCLVLCDDDSTASKKGSPEIHRTRVPASDANKYEGHCPCAPCPSIRFAASRKENVAQRIEDFLDLDAVVSGSEDQSSDTEDDDEEHMLKELELFIDDSESIPCVCCIYVFLLLTPVVTIGTIP